MIKTLTLLSILLLGVKGTTQITQLGSDIDGTTNSEFSAWSHDLSMDGQILAIGALNGSESFTNAGQIRFYEWDGSNWIVYADSINGSEAEANLSYVKLALNGTRAVIADFGNDDIGTNYGAVNVYDWDGSNWNQVGTTIYGNASNEFFAETVAVSEDGNTIVIPSKAYDADRGKVQVYEWVTTDWQLKGDTLFGVSADDDFGHSVSTSADGARVVVSAPQYGSATDFGRVYTYDWSGTAWDLSPSILAGSMTYENLAERTDLSSAGDKLIVTTGTEAILFNWDTDMWTEEMVWDAPSEMGPPPENSSIEDAVISGDGFTVCVSHHGTLSLGGNAGVTYVYDLKPWGWNERVDSPILGVDTNDQAGTISISENGATFSVGAIRHDFFKGHVRVYGSPADVSIDGKTPTEISIHPNPSNGLFQLSQELEKVEIFDPLGRLILTEEDVYQIDLTGHDPGVYILRARKYWDRLILR